MLMRVRGLLATVSIVAFLAACGGGGGGTLPASGGSGGGSTGGSTGSSSGALTSTAVERSDTQSALLGVQAYENAEGGAGGILTARRALVRVAAKGLLARARRDVTSSCSEGANGGGIELSEVPGSGDSEIVTIETFYDVNCKEPDVELVWTGTPSGDEASGPATYTQYSQSGAVEYTANAQVTIYYANDTYQTETGISMLLTSISGSDSGSLASMGLACSETSGACSLAAIDDTASGQVGAIADLSASASSISMQLQAYQGGPDALSIASGSPFPDWTISPSSDETASVSISGGAAAGGGFTLTMTDNLNGGTFSIDGTASGTIAGTLTPTGGSATDASFTIDAAGNGTVTYANGTTASIVDYVLQS